MRWILFLSSFLFTAGAHAQNDTIVRYWIGSVLTNIQSKAKTRAVYFQKEGLWHMESRFLSNGKLYLTGSYKDSEGKTKHGVFKWFYENGSRSSEVSYVDDKHEGLARSWHENGQISDSFFYKQGRYVKQGRHWNAEGHLTQLYDLDENGSGPVKLYRAKDSLSAEGSYVNGYRSGAWTYYAPEAYREWEVFYEKDSVVKALCFDATGKEKKDCIWEREAIPNGGLKGWKKYLEEVMNESGYPSRKLSKKEKNLSGTVYVRFLVEKDGSLSEIEIVGSLNPEADEIVHNAIYHAKKWTPGIYRGRIVRSYHTQPVTFDVKYK